MIYDRLMNYLTKHFLLHQNQYGFRQGLSTNHALLDVVTTAYSNIDKMLYLFSGFVDTIKPLAQYVIKFF